MGAGLISGVSFYTGILAIILVCWVPSKFKGWLAALGVVLTSAFFSTMAIQSLIYDTINFSLYLGSFIGFIDVKIDALSAWFILIINFTCITGVFYGIGYLKKYQPSSQKLNLHWSSFILFHFSMLWVCVLQHGFVFLVAWEIMSLSSMILVMFENEKQATIKAGINYFVQMHLSVIFLTIGFIWVYFRTGSFSFDALHTLFGPEYSIYLFILFFIGFGLKAGFIPLHTWLPHAHPAAPSHVSGVMSGVIVKLGIYGIIRMCCLIETNYIILGEIILLTSIITGLYGIINAAVYRDFKRMLAYCTIENIGIIGIGIGIGLIGMGNHSPIMIMLGFGGALLHTLNHSLFKSLLFFSAGAVYQQTHTRDMDKLGGLIRKMPRTAILFLIGSLAISGLPPFNGFISEFTLYKGLIEGIQHFSIVQSVLMVLAFAALSFIGGISVLTFTKTFSTIFLGSERTELKHKPQEVSPIMLVPQFLILALMLFVSFLPGFFFALIDKTLAPFNIEGIHIENSLSSLSGFNLYFAIFVLIIMSIWLLRQLFVKKLPAQVGPTWGCGYLAPTSKIQYTGKSFSKPLSKILNFITIEKKEYKEFKHGEIFPKKRTYLSNYFDFFEHRIIDPILQRLVFAANYFKFIQNGRVQSYVTYGFTFILIIFLFTFFYFLK